LSKIKHHQAYELYAQNIPLTQIATALGVSRQTISNWRKKYNWDEEILVDAVSSEELKAKEQRFIAQLIREFEAAQEEIEASDTPKKLALLEKYARTYYRLKAGGDGALNRAKLTKETAYMTIKEIADMAISYQATTVAQFLSEHADEIVELVRRGR